MPTAPTVVFPDDLPANVALGGKAAALAELARADLPVPAWFVVLPAAATPGPVAGELRWDDGARQALRSALDRLGDPSGSYAVRSSALEEDSARQSFAGQLDSFLHVQRDAVAERVTAVWASGFGARLIGYRRSVGADPLGGVPAVIVQQMVEGDVSGVAFSADPVSGRRGIAVIAAVRGLADRLVAGDTDADTWHVDRQGCIVEFTPASAPCKPDAAAPVLDDAAVLRVAALCRAAERHFGRPQDIEWTIAGGALYILQSRPITTLAERADPDGAPALWDNANIIESYCGVTTPLTFSFARRAYEYVYREFCRLVRVPEPVIDAHATMFASMLGLVRGRIYYNLYNWYRLLAVLPGYRSNRRFMEQMMGVRETLPAAVAEAQATLGRIERLRDAWRLAVSLAAFAWHLLTLERRIVRFNRRLDATLGQGRPDLSALRPDELAAYYRRLEGALLTHWDAPIVNDFATMISHGLLRKLGAAWLDDRDGALGNALLVTGQELVSEEPARRLRQMAALAAGDPALVTTLNAGSPAAVRAALASRPAIAALVHDYLERFGERCLEELKLESPTLHDDPQPLYRAVGRLAARADAATAGAPGHRDDAEPRAARARMVAALARHPLRRFVFMRVLSRARRSLRDRENLRFERTRVFGRARQILLELGKRLTALDCLHDPRDVFYLEIDELLGFVEARASTTDLKGLVAVRRAEFERHRQAEAPAERFETRGVVFRGHDYRGATVAGVTSGDTPGDTLRGLGCCPGVVRGPVRIVRDARNATIGHGDILVAERTDPGWVMIFPSAAGLLVERGSLLSHSAIVARELGLPAIVSIAGLTRWLKDGDEVVMDGTTGIVTRPAPTGPGHA